MANKNCQICNYERDESMMIHRNDLYFCDSTCYSAFYMTVGIKGANVEFQASETHLQWKYVSDTVWIDLCLLSELGGSVGSVEWDAVLNKPVVFPPSTHVHDNDHAAHSDDQDLSGKANVGHNHTGTYELANSNIQTHVTSAHAPSNAVALSTVKADVDIEDAIGKKHANTSDHSHSNKSTLDTYTQTETNLASAVSLKHSNSTDHSHTNKTTLDAVQEALTTALKSDYDIAVAHSGSSHAPSNAQKNSDITKAEIEAKLTGVISTHSHSGGSGNGFIISVQALTSSPVDSQTVYFGMLPKAPITTANVSKIYICKSCTLKHAEIYCYSGTAGTNEAWSLYVRKNNTTDTLIATLNVNTNERVFTNAALNISLVAGDYLEIKGVQPLWATNPATTIYGGYLYFE